MDELYAFINEKHDEQYNLLKVAIAHHRFTWIHPFDNGNGRVVRLLTYAMLSQQGFFIGVAKLINPTAVFCLDRNKYYSSLSEADKGTKDGILNWCEYMIGGLHIELTKISYFVNNDFLSKNIISPALLYSLRQGNINNKEFKILGTIAITGIVSAVDIGDVITMVTGNKLKSALSRIIRNLIDKKLIQPTHEGGRKYVINIANNPLLRAGLMRSLFANGFISLEQAKQIKKDRGIKLPRSVNNK